MLIIFVIIMIFLLALINKVEGYRDITPYKYIWDIYSCYDLDCIKKKSYECYKWCDEWPETGGAENCRVKCLDDADRAFEQMRIWYYHWNVGMPELGEYSLLK